MEFFRQLLQGIREAWSNLSLSARINIALATLAVTAIIGFVLYSGTQPFYVTLSSEVDPADAQKIVQTLSAQGIPYRLENGGRDVQVPVEKLGTAQLALAEAKLPVGRPTVPGLEMFQTGELMTNQWLQDVKFMRALQGEIQRQLNALDFVEYSYVLIREAREELFAQDQKPSEAAVTLKVRRPPTRQEIKAVVSLVSRAGGPNLSENNITVVTTDGTVLYLPPTTGFVSLANSKLEYIAELERQREAKLRERLRELGVRGTVSVSAKVGFEEKKVVEEKVSEGVELSTYTSTTTTSSREPSAEGTPGVLANVPGAGGQANPVNSEQTTEEIVNNEPSRTTITTQTTAGDVLKYMVTLIVEGNYKTTTDAEGKEVREYVPLTEAERQKYEKLALAAVGEGETPTEVTVYDQPFAIGQLTAAEESVQMATQWEQRELWGQRIWLGVQILLVLAAFFALRSILTRAMVKPVEEEAPIEIPTATSEDLRRQQVAQEIQTLSVKEPESVAALLRTWMTEEEE